MTDGTATRVARRSTRSMAGDRRLRKDVQVTPEEFMFLSAKAKNQGVSFSRLVVDSAMYSNDSQTFALDDLAELSSLLVEYRHKIAGATNNLNQLTRHANATQEFPRDAARLLARLHSMTDELETILANVKQR